LADVSDNTTPATAVERARTRGPFDTIATLPSTISATRLTSTTAATRVRTSTCRRSGKICVGPSGACTTTTTTTGRCGDRTE
jgi:hypothetical protein